MLTLRSTPTTASSRTGRDESTRAFGWSVAAAIIGVHVLLGVGGAISSSVATAHAIVTVAVTAPIMVFSKRPTWVVAAATYGGVCDVYWRMTRSQAPWEVSKYLLALGAVTLLIRYVREWRHGLVPILMILVLVPGIVLSALAEGIGFARENASGYEMGLLSFALAALAFRHLIADRSEAWNLGWIAMGPLIAALGVTTHALLTNPDIEFGSESNFAATGGYGPNQVSSTLGLITLFCVLLAFLPWARRLWPVLAGLGLWSLWATYLTFSRGGIYSLVAAGAAMLLVGITRRGARVKSLLMLGVTAVALVMVFASANDFSGNWLDSRYGDSQTAGRSTIAEMDLEVFAAHPILGVGTGRSEQFRGQGRLATAAAHTEFTRLLAEHGLLGVVALALLAAMLVQSYRWGLSYWNRLAVVALSVWALTTMLHAATRIGAVSVMLALTQLRVTDDLPERSLQSLPDFRQTVWANRIRSADSTPSLPDSALDPGTPSS